VRALPAPWLSALAPVSAHAADLVGLITKTEGNPFFVKMREGAQAKAKELGLKLQTFAGSLTATTIRRLRPSKAYRSRRQGLRHCAERLLGDRADHQEGTRRGPDGNRARHSARPDGCGGRNVCDDNRKAGQLIGAWAKGSSATRPPAPRSPSSTSPPTSRPSTTCATRFHAGLRHRREGCEPLRR